MGDHFSMLWSVSTMFDGHGLPVLPSFCVILELWLFLFKCAAARLFFYSHCHYTRVFLTFVRQPNKHQFRVVTFLCSMSTVTVVMSLAPGSWLKGLYRSLHVRSLPRTDALLWDITVDGLILFQLYTSSKFVVDVRTSTITRSYSIMAWSRQHLETCQIRQQMTIVCHMLISYSQISTESIKWFLCFRTIGRDTLWLHAHRT